MLPGVPEWDGCRHVQIAYHAKFLRMLRDVVSRRDGSVPSLYRTACEVLRDEEDALTENCRNCRMKYRKVEGS